MISSQTLLPSSSSRPSYWLWLLFVASAGCCFHWFCHRFENYFISREKYNKSIHNWLDISFFFKFTLNTNQLSSAAAAALLLNVWWFMSHKKLLGIQLIGWDGWMIYVYIYYCVALTFDLRDMAGGSPWEFIGNKSIFVYQLLILLFPLVVWVFARLEEGLICR